MIRNLRRRCLARIRNDLASPEAVRSGAANWPRSHNWSTLEFSSSLNFFQFIRCNLYTRVVDVCTFFFYKFLRDGTLMFCA